MIDKCRPFLDFEQSYIDMCCKLNHSPEVVRSKLKQGLNQNYPGWGMGTIYDSYRDDAMFLLGYGNRTPGEYSGKVVERQLIGERTKRYTRAYEYAMRTTQSSGRSKHWKDSSQCKTRMVNGNG
jgi:hypothetical protein